MGTDPTENVNLPRDLRSDFASDPDMREILELFVKEMPSRVRDLRASWEKRELDKVGRLAHQLKGAGGGYGFGVISEAAAKLEKSVTSLSGTPTTAVLNEMKLQVDTLVDLCSRASAR
jgi:HPt (histidine-containing phosphotransfer) domain-containing protein